MFLSSNVPSETLHCSFIVTSFHCICPNVVICQSMTGSADVVIITGVTAAERGLCCNVESGGAACSFRPYKELQSWVIIYVYITVKVIILLEMFH